MARSGAADMARNQLVRHSTPYCGNHCGSILATVWHAVWHLCPWGSGCRAVHGGDGVRDVPGVQGWWETQGGRPTGLRGRAGCRWGSGTQSSGPETAEEDLIGV